MLPVHVYLTNASFRWRRRAPRMCVRQLHLGLSHEHRLRGKVKEIVQGPVLSEIDVETPSGAIVTSVITTRSVNELQLKVGKDVIALVKATEVSLATL